MKELIVYNEEPQVILKKMKRIDNQESSTYAIRVTEPYDYMRLDEENNKILKPKRAPRFKEGETLKGTNLVITSLDFITGYGWTMTVNK